MFGLAIIVHSPTLLFGSNRAIVKSIGADHNVKLYSGGELVGEWTSDGTVMRGENGGYYFKDKSNGTAVRVDGDVRITIL